MVDDIDQEIRDERNRECIESRYDCWLSDNIRDLKADFYKDLLKNTPEAVKFEGETIEEEAINEYYPTEFNSYCKEQWEIYNE